MSGSPERYLQTLRASLPNLRIPFIVACILGYAVFLALLIYVFAQYPDSRLSTGSGPKANVPLWFGATGAEIAYLALGVVIACLYIYVAVQGTAGAGVWRQGAPLGAGLGLGWLVFGVVAALLPTGALGPVLACTLIIVPMAAGAWGTSLTGRFGSGPLAGFWCSIPAALLIALSTIAIDVVFAPHFMQTSWLHDPLCNALHGNALAACEIGDDLGFAASVTVGLPLLMAGLGAVGGAFGLAVRKQGGGGVRPAAGTAPGSRAPLVFSVVMALIVVVELVFNLW